MSEGAEALLAGPPTIDGAHFQAHVFSDLQGFGSSVVLSSGDAREVPGVATEGLNTFFFPFFFFPFCFEETVDPFGSGALCLPGSDPLASPDGFDSFDAVTLKLSFELPAEVGDLTFDWRFGSEEPPEHLSSVGFNPLRDYFRALLVVDGNAQDIAFLPDGSFITSDNAFQFSNQVNGTSRNPESPFPDPDDVGFNAVPSQTQTTSVDLAPHAGKRIEIWFRVADASDGMLDSGVLLGNLDIELTGGPVAITAAIDIRPGGNPNRINMRRPNGVIPVAILSAADFEATQVDPLSVSFGPGEAEEVHRRSHIEDVNGDGRLDMVLHFRTGDAFPSGAAEIRAEDKEACLTGETTSGDPLEGCDAVELIDRGRRIASGG